MWSGVRGAPLHWFRMRSSPRSPSCSSPRPSSRSCSLRGDGRRPGGAGDRPLPRRVGARRRRARPRRSPTARRPPRRARRPTARGLDGATRARACRRAAGETPRACGCAGRCRGFGAFAYEVRDRPRASATPTGACAGARRVVHPALDRDTRLGTAVERPRRGADPRPRRARAGDRAAGGGRRASRSTRSRDPAATAAALAALRRRRRRRARSARIGARRQGPLRPGDHAARGGLRARSRTS